MKNLKKIPIELIFLSCILAGCGNAQNVDLSSDQTVRNELAKSTTFSSKLDGLCIERPKELARIIVIGTHANDSDCKLDGAFINSTYFEDSAALSQNALNELGWRRADKLQRESLARLWVEKGLMAFFTVLYSKDKDFSPYRGITYRGGKKPNLPEFHPPQAVSTENGDIIVTLWVSYLRRVRMYRHHEFRFMKDGSLRND